ncbi:MAG TPA: nucleoporin [Aggregatilinea sp.]|uniref:nucleoporin FG repeat-containing protein n=1 Tax=Aggregatilinea sp. TaxID=2806333 RepID=UPI002BB00AB9|nr:nucleoporin [Aggregatilinea sp.]HML24853.1 nucleoporin [Aggregatilinea sp.]
MKKVTRAGRWLVGALLAALVVSMGGGLHTRAQGDSSELLLLGTLSTTLDATTPEASATFYLEESFPFSVVAYADSGDLTTTLTVTAPSGKVVTKASPSSTDATATIAEALVAPEQGIYTVTVTREGNTSGDMTLGLLTGYGGLDVWDDFESGDPDFNLTWSSFSADNSEGDVVNGMYQVHVFAPGIWTYQSPDEDLSWGDMYMEADVEIENQPSYVEYGFVLHLNWDAGTFYSLSASSDGDWSLYYYDETGTWQEIQPWTVSPVIDGADASPRIAALVEGYTFRFYFNDQFVGEVTDTAQYASEGSIGVAASTIQDQPDDVTVDFDNLVVTSPLSAGDVADQGGLEGLNPGTLFGNPTAAPQEGVEPTPTTGLPFGNNPTATPSGGLAIPTATPGSLTGGLFIPTATP